MNTLRPPPGKSNIFNKRLLKYFRLPAALTPVAAGKIRAFPDPLQHSSIVSEAIARATALYPPPLSPSHINPAPDLLRDYLCDTSPGKPIWSLGGMSFANPDQFASLIRYNCTKSTSRHRPLELRPVLVESEVEHVKAKRESALSSLSHPPSPPHQQPQPPSNQTQPPLLPWELSTWGMPYDPYTPIHQDKSTRLAASVYDTIYEEYLYLFLSQNISWLSNLAPHPTSLLSLAHRTLASSPPDTPLGIISLSHPIFSADLRDAPRMIARILHASMTPHQVGRTTRFLSALQKRESVPVACDGIPEDTVKEEAETYHRLGHLVHGGSLHTWLLHLLLSPADIALHHHAAWSARHSGAFLFTAPSIREAFILHDDVASALVEEMGFPIDRDASAILLSTSCPPTTLWGYQRIWREVGGAFRWSIPEEAESAVRHALDHPSESTPPLIQSLSDAYRDGGHSQDDRVAHALGLLPDRGISRDSFSFPL